LLPDKQKDPEQASWIAAEVMKRSRTEYEIENPDEQFVRVPMSQAV
jgi:hypothetical protein